MGVAQADLERGDAGELDQLGVDAGELAILLRVEQRSLDAMGAGKAGLGLHGLHAYLERILLDQQLGGVRLTHEAARLSSSTAASALITCSPSSEDSSRNWTMS